MVHAAAGQHRLPRRRRWRLRRRRLRRRRPRSPSRGRLVYRTVRPMGTECARRGPSRRALRGRPRRGPPRHLRGRPRRGAPLHVPLPGSPRLVLEHEPPAQRDARARQNARRGRHIRQSPRGARAGSAMAPLWRCGSRGARARTAIASPTPLAPARRRCPCPPRWPSSLRPPPQPPPPPAERLLRPPLLP